MLFGLLIWIPFSLMIGFDFNHLPKVLIYALISGILSEAFTFYVFSKGEISITGTIFASYPIYTIFICHAHFGGALIAITLAICPHYHCGHAFSFDAQKN